MIRVLAIVLAVLLAAPAHAAGLPIEVTADTFTVDEAKKKFVQALFLSLQRHWFLFNEMDNRAPYWQAIRSIC